MKKLILVCGLIAGLSTMGLAQTSNAAAPMQKHQHSNLSPEEKAKKDADRAEKDLGLTSAQKDQWTAAALKMANANKPIRDKMEGSTTPQERMDARKQLKANMDVFNNDVNAFLTPDQKTKRDQLRADRKSKHGFHKGHGEKPTGQ